MDWFHQRASSPPDFGCFLLGTTATLAELSRRREELPRIELSEGELAMFELFIFELLIFELFIFELLIFELFIFELLFGEFSDIELTASSLTVNICGAELEDFSRCAHRC